MPTVDDKVAPLEAVHFELRARRRNDHRCRARLSCIWPWASTARHKDIPKEHGIVTRCFVTRAVLTAHSVGSFLHVLTPLNQHRTESV